MYSLESENHILCGMKGPSACSHPLQATSPLPLLAQPLRMRT